MSKFTYTPEGFSEAINWSKTYKLENGKVLYDEIKGLPTSEDKLHNINKHRS